MAASLGYVLAQLQSWTSPRLRELSDPELLERFIEQRDELAFAALVSRHGPMVLRSCRRILGDVHEAEDAVQATFLILAQKAHKLRRPEELPGWLHGVARRVALKVRTKAASRPAQARLSDGLADFHPDPLARLTARELLDIFDKEVSRLPAAQRSAVILCCLEERTREEAARILGWTTGALKGHLERGRKRLQVRLGRRGIALSAVLAFVVGSHGEAASALLLRSTVTAALNGGIGSPAALLAHSVLRTMLLGKLAGIMTVVLTAALAASAVALTYRGSTIELSDDKPPAAAALPNPPESPEQQARVDRFGDPLPEGALLRLGSIRYRAGAGINHAALSPDGKFLATASESGITIFELATGRPRHIQETGVTNGFDSLGSNIAFSADGKQFVNVNNGGGLYFWDVATGKRLRVVGKEAVPIAAAPRGGKAVPMIAAPPAAPAASEFFTKVWFPSKGQYAIAGADHLRFVVFVEPSTGKIRHRFQVAGELASVVSDGKTLAIVDAQRSDVILYDDAGKELRRFHHQGKIGPTTLCREGKRLVTLNDKAEIKIWNAATGKELRTIAGPATMSASRSPTAVSIAADGSTLYVGTRGGDILRWDLRDGKEQNPLNGHASFVTGLFHTPDGRYLVSVSWDNLIHRWNLKTGKAEPVGGGFAKYIRVTRSPDGRSIASASYPDRLEFWEAKTGKRLRTFSLPAKWISKVRFSPDGKRLALGCSDARVRLWDVEAERVASELKLPAVKRPGDGGEAHFEGLAWSPDGRFLAASMMGDGIRMWEAATGKELWHTTRGGSVAFSPDGKTLVAGGWDKLLIFRDAATGAVRSTHNEDSNIIDGVAFSPDGSWLATCHHGGNVYLRDPKTGAVRHTLLAHRGVAWSISFYPDSKWMVSSGDETVCVWEVATGTEVLCRKGHESRAYQAEFGPDGRTVLSSSMDLTALLWDIRPRSEAGRKRNLETLWTDLAAEPAKAYSAIWELAGDASSASAMLRKKLPPVKIDVDEKRLRALLADLDSDDFDKRESANRALAAMVAAVEIPLRRALGDSKSAEAKRHLRGLLDALKREPTPDDHRLRRAVQVMELCATAEALKVLREWAGGTAGAPLTEQAKAALARLAGKAEPRP